LKEIRSFDLVSRKAHIEACDMAHLPLKNEYANVCIFSLALMNTNYLDFIKEAHRVLKFGGYLFIAEVLSRLPSTKLFVKLIKSMGFKFQKYVKYNCTIFKTLDKEEYIFHRFDIQKS
jgi:ubiquinone/menaquinone biosynthesis C-methylase UbiE